MCVMLKWASLACLGLTRPILQLDAADDKGRKSAQQQVDRQVSRLNNFSKELDTLRAMPPPKIEVRS